MSLNNNLRGHKDLHIDVDSLTISMNYVPVVVGNQTNGITGTKDNIVTGQAEKKTEPKQEYILIPFCITDPLISQGPKDSEEDVGMKPTEVNVSRASDKYGKDDQDTEKADLNNLETTMNVSPIPTTRIHKDHPEDQIIRDFNSAIQTRRMIKIFDKHAMKVIQALKDPRWIEAMQEELLQFQLQKVWTLVKLPNGKRAIGTKWVFRNKKDKRGIVITNKARLVA
ncbi:putative ribonuclease H-like domain-containing protein, partial [Tanacetum coccineum]